MPSLAILVSGVLVLSCGQTDKITEADEGYTHTHRREYTHPPTWTAFMDSVLLNYFSLLICFRYFLKFIALCSRLSWLSISF